MSELVIVGGGLAGAHAGALLALRGHRPMVLERRAEPADKICGEFLSAAAQASLSDIGINAAELGAAPIRRVRLAAGSRVAEAMLPFPALGLSRRRLDEALLTRAEALGADVRRGVAVRAVCGERLETSLGDLRPRSIILATGKHDVRGARRPATAGASAFIGFKSYFALAPAMTDALADAVEIVFFEGGYAGLQLVEGGRANLCLIVRRNRFETLGRTWPALLARLKSEPHLAARLDGATELTGSPLTVANVPFGYLHAPSPADRLFRVGDQAAVIDSFTGDGMSIALHSARLAAEAVASGAGPEAYHARLRADLARPVRLAGWLRRRTERWPGPTFSVAALAVFPALTRALANWTRTPRSRHHVADLNLTSYLKGRLEPTQPDGGRHEQAHL